MLRTFIRVTSCLAVLTFLALAGSGATSAVFQSLDTNTQGNWKGVYGQDGYIIANDSSSQPAYGTATIAGAATFTWSPSSTDPRSLLKGASATDRIASTFYAASSFSIDLNFTDGQVHQVALYCLDLDTTTRKQTIAILDADTNTILNSQQVSNFHNGVYAVWNLQGHTIARITNDGDMNAVVAGVFFRTPGNSKAPSVSITNPTAGAVAGTVTVTAVANAVSPATIASVQFQLDGSNLPGTVTAAGSSYSIVWDTTLATNTPHTLTAIATDSLSVKTTSSSLAVTVANGGSASATFAGTDTATQGNWKSKYGQDGYIIANDSYLAPAYASVPATTANTYTWYASTTDTRALMKGASGAGRIASTYYSSTGFSFDVNLIDGLTHRVAMYCLDLDNGGRKQTISIVDANTNSVLSSQTLTNFTGGVYAVWNLQGHVTIQVTSGGGFNAVVSGLFFGAGTAPPPSQPAVSLTLPTPGTISGTVTVTANATAGAGIASVQFQLDGSPLTGTVTAAGPVYSLSWNTLGTSDGAHTLTAVATDTAGQQATSAGVTVTVSNGGPIGTSAVFVKFDATTGGTWKGVYGGDGAIIANDTTTLPAYALAGSAAPTYTWYASTQDSRALLKGASTTDRIASTFYSGSSVSFDVNLTDGQTHQVALYCLDLDSTSRSQTISILNASTNALLDSQAMANFHNGVYAVWNLQGHVIVKVTYTGGSNAVVSGLFFGAGGSGPGGPPALTLSTNTLTFSGNAGGANPGGQNVTIGNTGGGTLNWTAGKTQSWLTLSATSGAAPSSLGIGVLAAGLAAGTYTDTVTVNAPGAGGSPQMVTVTLTLGTVTAALVQIACGNNQSYLASDGTTWQADASSTGGQQIYSGYASGGTPDPDLYKHARAGFYGDFSYNIPIPNGNYLLTLKFAEFQYSGKGSRVFNVLVNTNQVLTNFDIVAEAGSYAALDKQFAVAVSNGAIEIAVRGVVSVGILNAIQVTPYTGTVPPWLHVSSNSVTFTGVAGTANPAGKTINVINTGGGTMNWTASNLQSWLNLAPASGTGTAALGFSVTTTGLGIGTYTDTVTVTASGVTGSPEKVTVTLILTAQPPVLTLSANTLAFTGTALAANPPSQVVSIANGVSGPLNWTASTTQTWLTLSATSGSAPSNLTIGILNAGLTGGTYTALVTIESAGAAGSPQDVTVTLNLAAAPPTLVVSAGALNFYGIADGQNPDSQLVTLANSAGGALNWTAAKTQSWLTLSATAGSSPTTLTVGVLSAGLPNGTYTDTLTITASGIAGSPKLIPVTFSIAATANAAPVAYWTFDSVSVSGNVVLDSSPSSLNGVINGGVSPVSGKVNQGLSFNGSTGYITTGTDQRPAMTGDLTLAAWIKTTNASRVETLLSKYNSSGQEDGYIFETTASGYLALHLGGSNINGSKDIIDGTNAINDGNWHHAAVIIRAGQDVSFYVDGGLSSVYYLTTFQGALNSPVGIGGPPLAGSNLFTGSMDEVRIYRRALSNTELAQLYGGIVTTLSGGEKLYNGIAMPKNFPPPLSATQMPRTPYYINNPPRVIPIDVGRQLFVDDFLVEQTSLQRVPHLASIAPNPLPIPGSPISAGAWYNPATQLYQLWYYDGNTPDYRYTYSTDGRNWTRSTYPDVLVPNTNEVVSGGDTIWLDQQETNPARRYKSFQVDYGAGKIYVYFSPDGIHWSPRQDFNIKTVGDRTTFFWNPFRNVWVNSDRGDAGVSATPSRAGYEPRIRYYSESKDLLTWTPSDPAQTFWTGPDDQDPPYYLYGPGGQPPELYTLDCVAYESVMVGLFSWFYPGLGYRDYTLPGPVLVEIGAGFSRDGFSWVRPTRSSGPGGAFIPASSIPGTWNAYNTQSASGGFLVVGDELWFYFSARDLKKPLDGTFSTGLATLRRDGFYSMDAGAIQGTLTTRPVRFSGGRLFVNVKDPAGQLLVEVLDANGNVIPQFSKNNCLPVAVDKTLQEVIWSGASLSALAGQDVKFKFYLTNGSLYSFWVTSSAQGASNGYVAAGGPGFTGVTDTVGAGH